MPTVPNHLAEQISTVPSNGKAPLGFAPSPISHGSPHDQVILQNTGGDASHQRHAAPYRASSDSDSGQFLSPESVHAILPVPATYSASAMARPAARMIPISTDKPVESTGSTDGGGHDSRISRRQSTASLGSQQSCPSYSRYDPNMYNDPAYLVNNDSLIDSVMTTNTAVNEGGGPVKPVHV